MGLMQAPITIAAQIGMYPALLVTAASPTTKPVEQPISVGFPLLIVSISIQDSIPAAAAVFVVIKARTAISLAAPALPALKPNHPNQSRLAPSRTNGTLCGR